MKILPLLVLLAAGHLYAQTPVTAVRRDSLPSVFPPDVMPNAKPSNSFYRYHLDPPNVVRATLDNMPVKVPDSSSQYTMLRSYQNYLKPNEPPMQFFKPMLPVLPKKP